MADKVLEDVRIELKGGLTLPVIKQLLDYLKSKKVFNGEEVESILEENLSLADKARKLIDSVIKKGAKASAVMLAQLKKFDEFLYNELELENRLKAPSPAPAPASKAPDHTGLNPGKRPTASAPESSDPSFLNPDKVTHHSEYPMTSNPRGLCLIINNVKFKDPRANRGGSDYDAGALRGVFTFLGFKVDIHQDLTAKQMKKVLLDYSKKDDHGDCFVCCVLSYGVKDGVIGIDWELCRKQDIFFPFDGTNCPSLVGKPKVFFIQACRGENLQEKVLVYLDDAAGGVGLTSDAQRSFYTIPQDSDFLVSFSTVENFVSYRNSDGSWFIQSLCRNLLEGSKTGEDILTILTQVNEEVSRREGIVKVMVEKDKKWFDAKMTPESCFTLRKKLIFRIPQ